MLRCFGRALFIPGMAGWWLVLSSEHTDSGDGDVRSVGLLICDLIPWMPHLPPMLLGNDY